MWVFNITSCAFYTILSTKQLLLLPNLKMFANLLFAKNKRTPSDKRIDLD